MLETYLEGEAPMASVTAVCISETKGTRKRNIFEGYLKVNHGLLGDAQSGNWHRQIGLLAKESIEEMCALGLNVGAGGFGENFTTEGLDLVA
jgi:MOSC domain-containing protein YiiM